MAVQQRVRKTEKGHIGPNHGDLGRLSEVGQHSTTAEVVPMTLAVCLRTGNDLSVCGRGGDLSLGGSVGKLTHATTALSKFDLGNTGSTTYTGTTGTTFNIVRSNDGSSGRARGVSDDFGTCSATGSAHSTQIQRLCGQKPT